MAGRNRKSTGGRRPTAIVPRIVFSVTVAGVVPACVSGCGQSTSLADSGADISRKPDDIGPGFVFDVAAPAPDLARPDDIGPGFVFDVAAPIDLAIPDLGVADGGAPDGGSRDGN